MKNKPFSHFDDFVIIFRKDRVTREGVEIAADVVEVEEDNAEDEQFVDATENYHKEPREEREEENREDIATSTCNIVVATSNSNQKGKKQVKSFDHSMTWLSSWL